MGTDDVGGGPEEPTLGGNEDRRVVGDGGVDESWYLFRKLWTDAGEIASLQGFLELMLNKEMLADLLFYPFLSLSLEKNYGGSVE